jgi:hypothetical protein
MSDEERVPVEVYCLASFLAEEMEARGWTSVDVGVRMCADDSSDLDISKNILVVDLLLAVQDDRLVISPETYRQLERAFSVSDGFFERLDAPWHKYPDRRAPFHAPDFLYSRS